MADTLSEPDSEVEAPYFAALPGDVLRLLFKHLGLKDLLNAASTCLSWNRCARTYRVQQSSSIAYEAVIVIHITA